MPTCIVCGKKTQPLKQLYLSRQYDTDAGFWRYFCSWDCLADWADTNGTLRRGIRGDGGEQASTNRDADMNDNANLYSLDFSTAREKARLRDFRRWLKDSLVHLVEDFQNIESSDRDSVDKGIMEIFALNAKIVEIEEMVIELVKQAGLEISG